MQKTSQCPACGAELKSTDCGREYHHERDCEPLVRLLVKRGHHHDCAARVGEVSGCIESEHYQHPNKKCTCGLTEALAHWEKVRGLQ